MFLRARAAISVHLHQMIGRNEILSHLQRGHRTGWQVLHPMTIAADHIMPMCLTGKREEAFTVFEEAAADLAAPHHLLQIAVHGRLGKRRAFGGRTLIQPRRRERRFGTQHVQNQSALFGLSCFLHDHFVVAVVPV